jgi:hypothetical protein
MFFSALVLLVSALLISDAEAQTAFTCNPTMTRVMVRDSEAWKEVQPKTSDKQTIIRELKPDEMRVAGKTWGYFLSDDSAPATVCSRYENILTCGNPGNTLDFNMRTGRYVRTFFSSFLSRDSSEIFIEAGRCAAR